MENVYRPTVSTFVSRVTSTNRWVVSWGYGTQPAYLFLYYTTWTLVVDSSICFSCSGFSSCCFGFLSSCSGFSLPALNFPSWICPLFSSLRLCVRLFSWIVFSSSLFFHFSHSLNVLLFSKYSSFSPLFIFLFVLVRSSLSFTFPTYLLFLCSFDCFLQCPFWKYYRFSRLSFSLFFLSFSP